MKAIEQYFHMVLFIMLYKVVLTFSLWIKPQCVAIQMEAIEQYFHMVILVWPWGNKFKDFEWNPSVCPNESYWPVFLCGTVYYTVQGGSSFEVCGLNLSVSPFKWKLLSSTFMWYYLLCCTRMKPLCVTIQMKGTEQYFHVILFIMLYKEVLTFMSVDETLVCDQMKASDLQYVDD